MKDETVGLDEVDERSSEVEEEGPVSPVIELDLKVEIFSSA